MNDNGSFQYYSFEENSSGGNYTPTHNNGCLDYILTAVMIFLGLLVMYGIGKLI